MKLLGLQVGNGSVHVDTSAELLSPVARAKGVPIRSLPRMLRDTGGASVRDRFQAPSSLGGGQKLDALSTYRVYRDNE